MATTQTNTRDRALVGSILKTLPSDLSHYGPLLDAVRARGGRARRGEPGRHQPTWTALALRGPNSSASIGSSRSNERLWNDVMATVSRSFRKADVRLSDGQTALILLCDATHDGALAAKHRFATTLASRIERLEAGARVQDLIETEVFRGYLGEAPIPRHRSPVPPGRDGSVVELPLSDSGAASHGEKIRWSAIVKRAVDVLGAATGIVLTAPLLLLIGLGIKIASPGPMIFRQQRLGIRGTRFGMLKFRTMRVDADESKHRSYMRQYISGSFTAEETQSPHRPRYKLADDNRVFPLGALLRRWSLDELPQLFNILRGDMSLVGPRPSVHYELESYRSWHRERLAMRPGLTGLWQVHGRGRTTFDDMTRLDIRYVRGWSIMRDLRLILLTPSAVFGRKGAA